MNTNNYEHLKLNNQLCHRLYLASNALTRIYRPLLENLNISYPQYIVLMALWERDEVSMGELAKHTRIDKGFLTTLIKKLLNDSIVKLISDQSDKRKKIIKLTKKGWRLREKASSIPKELVCQYSLSKDFDAHKLALLLDEMIDNFYE